MKNFLMWAVFHIPLGRLAPYILGLALGCKPEKKGRVND